LAAFIFLAAGLAPRRREDAAIAIEPVAIAVEAPATPMKTLEGRRKGAGRRHRACYLARLQREFPATAKRVEAGELSVHRACIKAGLRKEPAKPFKWTSIEAYAPATADASHAKTRPGNREAFFCVCRRSAPGQDADRRDNFLMPLIRGEHLSGPVHNRGCGRHSWQREQYGAGAGGSRGRRHGAREAVKVDG
jgi:hypothetical protein